ncbi:MAG TPA: lysoplasmalogenase [Clostridia bacterium]|nr:lysoplasmalogenase [Clostridia bacterium]
MSNQVGFTLSVLVMMLMMGLSYQIACETGWYAHSVRLAFKGLTTLFAAMLALYAYTQNGHVYALIMAAGIVLCAVADVLLELHFLTGMACFAAGHLFYIASFLIRARPGTISLQLFIVLFILCTLAAFWARKKVSFPLLPLYLYSLIISLMVASALGQTPLVFLGAVLFILSDTIIGRRMVFPDKKPWNRPCIALYYSAQFILAMSLLI